MKFSISIFYSNFLFQFFFFFSDSVFFQYPSISLHHISLPIESLITGFIEISERMLCGEPVPNTQIWLMVLYSHLSIIQYNCEFSFSCFFPSKSTVFSFLFHSIFFRSVRYMRGWVTTKIMQKKTPKILKEMTK